MADLYEVFSATVKRADPDFDVAALAAHPAAGLGLPHARALAEARRFAWQLDIIEFDEPRVQAHLRGLEVGSWIARDVLLVEERIRRVLRIVEDDVRSARLSLIASHPETHRSFAPDAALLRNQRGFDRSRNQLRAADGSTIANLQFDEITAPIPLQRSDPSAKSETLGPQVGRVAALMEKDDPIALGKMSQKAMAARYSSSKRTCSRARDHVLGLRK